MSNVGYATLTVLPSAKGFAGALAGEIDGPLSSAGRDSGKKAGGGFVGAFKGLVGPAIAIAGSAMFGGFIKEAAMASDATDKFKSTMSFAGLDTSAIDAATKAAKGYADQTVYDLPTIQNMIAQLASNGVKDYTGLTQAAGNLNAVAGGNADTFKSVAMVMTQTAGAGKLTTENWNQLADAIPGASGPLQKALEKNGAFTGNFRDAMADGQITAEEFNQALMELGTDPIAVEAAKSTKTFEGAIGNLQATINSGLMGALNELKPAITGAINWLSSSLGKSFEWIGNAYNGLKDLFANGNFSDSLAKAFHVEEDSAFVDYLFNVRDAFKDMTGAFKSGDTATIGNFFTTLISGAATMRDGLITAISQAIPQVLSQIVALAPQILNAAVQSFSSLVTAISLNLPPLITALLALVPMIVTTLTGMIPQLLQAGVQLFLSLVDAITLALPQILASLGQVIPQILTSLLGALPSIINAGLQLFTGLVQGLIVAIPLIISAVIGMLPQIATALTSALPQIVTAGLQLFSGIVQALGQFLPVLIQALIGLLPTLSSTLLSMLPQIITAGLQLFQGLVDAVVQILPMLIGAIFQLLPQIIQTLLGMLPSIIQSGLQLFLGVVTGILQALPQIVRSIMGMLPSFLQTLLGMLPQLIQAAVTLFTGIVNAIPQVVPQIISALIQILPVMVSTLIQMLPTLVQAGMDLIRGLADGLARAAGSVVGALFTVGKQIIQGLIDGIGSMMGAIGNAIISLVPGPIVGVFKDLLGIHSPSRVFRGFGVNIGEGLILGIQDKYGDVEKTVARLAEIPAGAKVSVPTVSGGGVAGAVASLAGSTAGGTVPQIVQENHFNAPMDEQTYAELAARRLLRAGVTR